MFDRNPFFCRLRRLVSVCPDRHLLILVEVRAMVTVWVWLVVAAEPLALLFCPREVLPRKELRSRQA
jgi:hypothetical protein